MKQLTRVYLFLLLAAGTTAAADFQAGVARVRITPTPPYWLSGYAARTRPADVVLQDLWAKALAIRDADGGRVVLVTTDLIGLPREVSDEVGRQAQNRYQLEPSQLALNCSHTHCGPAVGRNLSVMFDFNAEDERRVAEYTARLTTNLIQVIGDALHDLAPARLAVGHGSVDFAINRRQATTNGFRIGLNTNGPTDHDVPVLRVTAPDGRSRAVLFGYGCHNTTLGGDFYQINGDYAGQAQAELERALPGTTAMFLMLCGGDQNPNPRGTVALAQQHGAALAGEVARVTASKLAPVRPPIRTARENITLDFAPHTREQLEMEAKGPDRFRQRRARLMLAAYDRGEPVRQTPYPVQAIRFGNDLTLLTLGGEVVVDYALRSKREFPRENLVVSGYCNDVMCYIPSRRVLLEGGYEPLDSMIYYGQPGPFAESVEEKIFAAIHDVMRQAGAK